MPRVGVDTGGKFTDLVLVDDSGLHTHKLRSTPDDPARAIVTGVRELLQRVASDGARTEGFSSLDIVHGSTVATNALLERKGARVALIVTAGFEDVLQIGRQTRRELYNFLVEDRRPLIEPGLTFGVSERLDASGTVVVALRDEDVRRVAQMLCASGVDAVAICFLHSYANDRHERAAGLLCERAGLDVSCSSAVLCEHREFERWSTTVVNAYVTPVVARYLERLEARLESARLSIMQSNGGFMSATRARAAAVQTMLSGPAAGVVGARTVACTAGIDRLITFDMGGTSTDVSLVDGAIGFTTESIIGDCPVRLPTIDIHTVGAGGGSIAYVDTGGALRVGPQSAGAVPGPACYGVGDEFTVTDANLLLGRLDPESFLGGRMALDIGRARQAGQALARRIGVEIEALALGVVRIANANMERAIRVVSIERGHDPRDFTLLAFGGAGGMHACDLAAALDMSTVLVPRYAGVLSAMGALCADATKDYSKSLLCRVDAADSHQMEREFTRLEERARSDLGGDGFAPDDLRLERSLDVRYVGQSYEISVPWVADLREELDRRHLRLYGYAHVHRPAEIVNLRVRGIGFTSKPVLPTVTRGAGSPSPITRRRAVFGSSPQDMPVFRLEDLAAGAGCTGPALVSGEHATVLVPPTHRFSVDGWGNIVATPLARRVQRRHRRRREAGTEGQ